MHTLDLILKDIQREFIAIPGVGKNIEEVSIKGIKAYTSSTLKKNVKKSLSKNVSSKIFKLVSSLIDQNRIIPIFTSKNIIQHFMRRKEYHPLGTTIGDKFYLFIESFYGKFKITSVDEKELAKTVMHELMHVANNLNRKQFLKINYKVIIEFYKTFFTEYLEIKNSSQVNDSIFEEIIKYQTKAKKTGTINFWKMLLPIFKKLEKYDNNMTDNDYKKAFNILGDYLDTSFEKFTENIPTNIFKSAKKAYEKIGCKVFQTFAQEMWTASEIICILAQENPNHPNVYKTINLLK